MLGWVESEGETALAKPEEFAMQETCMVAEIRQDLLAPNLPYVIGEFENGASSTRAIYRDTVARRILLTPTIVANSAIVSSAALTYTDDHHFDCASQKVWGERAFTIFKDKGWLPGSTSVADRRFALRRESGIRECVAGDEMQLFDAAGRLVASAVAGAGGSLPRFSVRGIYIVKHIRRQSVLTTSLKCFF
jgi:hypothetical protein